MERSKWRIIDTKPSNVDGERISHEDCTLAKGEYYFGKTVDETFIKRRVTQLACGYSNDYFALNGRIIPFHTKMNSWKEDKNRADDMGCYKFFEKTSKCGRWIIELEMSWVIPLEIK